MKHKTSIGTISKPLHNKENRKKETPFTDKGSLGRMPVLSELSHISD